MNVFEIVVAVTGVCLIGLLVAMCIYIRKAQGLDNGPWTL